MMLPKLTKSRRFIASRGFKFDAWPNSQTTSQAQAPKLALRGRSTLELAVIKQLLINVPQRRLKLRISFFTL